MGSAKGLGLWHVGSAKGLGVQQVGSAKGLGVHGWMPYGMSRGLSSKETSEGILSGLPLAPPLPQHLHSVKHNDTPGPPPSPNIYIYVLCGIMTPMGPPPLPQHIHAVHNDMHGPPPLPHPMYRQCGIMTRMGLITALRSCTALRAWTHGPGPTTLGACSNRRGSETKGLKQYQFFFREYIPLQEYLIIIEKNGGNMKLLDWGKRWPGYSQQGMWTLLGGSLAFPAVTVKFHWTAG